MGELEPAQLTVVACNAADTSVYFDPLALKVTRVVYAEQACLLRMNDGDCGTSIDEPVERKGFETQTTKLDSAGQ